MKTKIWTDKTTAEIQYNTRCTIPELIKASLPKPDAIHAPIKIKNVFPDDAAFLWVA